MSYLTFLDWASKEDQHVGSVHFAEFHHPADGPLTAAVKLFPSTPTHRGLINEITGWLVANALELPQPKRAFLARIPLERLGPLRGWLREAAAGKSHWVGFCTQRLPGQSAALAFHPDSLLSPALLTDVKGWAHLHPTIALDEHIANTDRHLNNLRRLGRQQYAVLDHDRLATPNAHVRDWNLASVDANRQYAHRLSDAIWPEGPGDRDYGATQLCAGTHANRLTEVLPELQHWAYRLLPPAEAKAWTAFMQARAQVLEVLLAKRYRRLN
ncbi:MAG: hypothetical protein EOO27_04785 [Comamonadaceae bacterium]|nr:MAG: hypothetical protein EOO27_04785 [Comamonadaceae bacterium]